MGADAYRKSLIQTKPGLVRFWSEFHTASDEPFRSFLMLEFAKRSAAAEPLAPAAGIRVP